LTANVLASPCLHQGCPHEVTVIKNCPSAGAGLNRGLERARHEWVVCIHQDVVLGDGWDRCVAQQLREAERRFGPIGVAGVYGVGDAIPAPEPDGVFSAARTGWVVDRGRVLRDGPALPAAIATLDELLLIVRRDAGLRFDDALGFHLYGADLCLQARARGLGVVVVEALCQHNSRSVGLPEAFYESARVLARKWEHRLPVATPCAVIDHGGRVFVLGNATDAPGSLAFASSDHGWDLATKKASRKAGALPAADSETQDDGIEDAGADVAGLPTDKGDRHPAPISFQR
jgi:hypothetical protein